MASAEGPGPGDIGGARKVGAAWAYAGDAPPGAGNLLTVAREDAGAATEDDVAAVVRSARQAAEVSLARTPELLPQLRASLLRNAVDNVLALGPAGALTGPAERGDTDLVNRQAQAATSWDATSGNAYRALREHPTGLASAAPAGRPDRTAQP